MFSLTHLILATHVILLYEAGSINVPTFQMKKQRECDMPVQDYTATKMWTQSYTTEEKIKVQMNGASQVAQ